MELNLDDRAKLREASQAYKETDLAKDNNEYFEEKPYWMEHLNANQWAKAMAIVGHLLSILIGSICGYHLGKALFSGFDLLIWGSLTLGSVLGLTFIVLLTGSWEVIKNKFLHRFFKEWYQFKRKYTTTKQWGKLMILFGTSLVLSGYGGFEVVSRWFGDAETSETTLVDVDEKVQHIVLAIASKQARIDTLEQGQQWYVTRGKERRVKADNKIHDLEAEITPLNQSLIDERKKWDDHNITANGATTTTNKTIEARHDGEKIWYALLFSLFAILADTLTLYCIRYNERYRYQSHREMMGAEYFVQQSQARNHKMQVVYRAETTSEETTNEDVTTSHVTSQDETRPAKTTIRPQDTTSKKETSPVAGNKTIEETIAKKKHGDCYWDDDGKAFMWYRLQTNGSIVAKDARQLKGLRNKAIRRANDATAKAEVTESDKVKKDKERIAKNNNKQAESYHELYTKLTAFIESADPQTQKTAI